jgi:DNA-directed RNA polymerase specialized sigma24 family protein
MEPSHGDDFEAIVERYGLRLFVLAYRLTGDRDQADELSQHVLVSSCVESGTGAGGVGAFDLCRALVAEWHASLVGRWGTSSLEEPRRSPEAGGRPASRDWLQEALGKLGPRDREVLVLRVGEGLDYEEIADAILDPIGLVQRRLLRARRRLYDLVGRRVKGPWGEPVRLAPSRRPSTFLERAMNLYLDDRLSRPRRTEFERRVEGDVALREAVEFHRGLTLEFQEEAPVLPRDYARRAIARMTRAAAPRRAAASAPAGGAGRGRLVRRPIALALLAGVAVALLAVSLPTMLRRLAARRADLASLSGGGAAAQPEAAPQPADAAPSGAGTGADEQTRQALRSLGYLGSGATRETAAPRRTPGEKQPSGAVARPRGTPRPAPRATRRATPRASPAATPPPAGTTTLGRPAEPPVTLPAEPTPAPPAEAAPARATEPSPEAGPGPAGESAAAPGSGPPGPPVPAAPAVGHRAVPAPRAPGSGRDHEVVGSAEAWAALHGGSPAPSVDFQKEWVVLLPDGLGTDPPTRLRVAAVRRAAGAIEIECRAEAVDPAAGTGPPPGQALVLPLPVSPVRLVTPQP